VHTPTTTAGRIGVWVLSALLAFIFLMAGVPKLAGAEGHIRHFVTWGYPDWFRIVVGAVETVSAALLLVPRLASQLAFCGALGIAAIMAGATYTHLVRVPEEAGRAPFTLGLLTVAAVVAWARRPQTRPTSAA
jgi:putative oxidoreductase